ncbi:MAG: C-GCAxxG-C-C family protein [Clostridiales Family XIII bacterium]|jgi:hypothetical protein|nr:C-GCAxxG-C-C family protein [Clostridiales Family XIII bacterium]
MTIELKRTVSLTGNQCCRNLMLKLASGDISDENGSGVANLAERFAEVTCGRRACAVHYGSGFHRSVEGTDRGQYPVIGDGAFCGALAAAVAVLYSVKKHEEAVDCQDELMDWFHARFGGYDCEVIAADPDVPRDDFCPKVILATYLRLRDYIDPDNHLSQKELI